jgi:hypothetical protein
MDQSVRRVFDSYPPKIKTKMNELRSIILDVASILEKEKSLVETLKWGEPSYLLEGGSTVRIDWKESNPKYLGIFFNCRTKLIDTFRATFGNELQFEGNRAILLDTETPLPKELLFQCIQVALTYHKRKKPPLLGV